MADIKTIREDKIEEIKEAEGWECQGKNAAKNPEEFENRYIAKMLADYISEEDNYVVDRAVISCSHMSEERVEIIWDKEMIALILRDGNEVGDSIEVPNISGEDPPYDHYYLPEADEEGIRILRAVHASEQTDNGIPFATVIDCTCQRDVDEGKTQDKASILSFGNCSILKDSDIQEIERRHDKAVKYGTCYCLMKPVKEWLNPFCMESVVGDYEGINLSKPDIFNVGARGIQQPRPECKIISHHKTMEWSTAHGKKEGLTMLSTLLCTRGGVISVEFSGQRKLLEIEDEAELTEPELTEPDLSDPQAVKEYVWEFFRNKGLSDVAVAGILGNVQRECEFDLGRAAEDNSDRFGLFQWSTDEKDARRNAFIDWAASENRDINLISTQCDYAYIEIMTGGMLTRILDVNDNNPSELVCNKEALIEADTPEEAARIFAASFERCCISYYIDSNGAVHFTDIQHSFDRQRNARTIYDDMRGEGR